MAHRIWVGVSLGLLLFPPLAFGQTVETRALTLEGARAVAEGAAAEAGANGWEVVIAIVDAGGHLIYLERMDGVSHGIVDIAIGKAKTSAAFGSSTDVFAEMVAQGGVGLLAVPGALPIEGGVPLTVHDEVIGAIGVSGVTGEQDGIIARAGAAALSR